MKAAPFARHVVQVVALLPALQAVRLGVARLGGVGARLARHGGQDAGERFQPLRQVVLELDAGQRVARGELRSAAIAARQAAIRAGVAARKCAPSACRPANASFPTASPA